MTPLPPSTPVTNFLSEQSQYLPGCCCGNQGNAIKRMTPCVCSGVHKETCSLKCARGRCPISAALRGTTGIELSSLRAHRLPLFGGRNAALFRTLHTFNHKAPKVTATKTQFRGGQTATGHTHTNLNLRLVLDLLFPTKWDLERVICATCRGGTTYLDPWKVIGWKDWSGSDSRWTLLAAAGQQRRRVGRTVEGRAAIHAGDPGHSPT